MTVRELRELLFNVENQDRQVAMCDHSDINDADSVWIVGSGTINCGNGSLFVLMPSVGVSLK